MTNHIDSISRPRDLSKTHKRCFIGTLKTDKDKVEYFRTEDEAKKHSSSYYPCMVTNETFDRITH